MTIPGALYAGAPAEGELTGSMTTLSASVGVSTMTGWPSPSTGEFFVVIINSGAANQEKCQVGSQDGSTAYFTERGYDGTTAQTHAAGEPIIPIWDAVSAQLAADHINDTTRNDHTQYLESGYTGVANVHDVPARHTFGSSGALGTPGATSNILAATSGATGVGSSPSRSDHVHAGIPGVSGVTGGWVLAVDSGGGNGMAWVAGSGVSGAVAFDASDNSSQIKAGATGALDPIPTGLAAYSDHVHPAPAYTRQVATLTQQTSVTTYTTPGITADHAGTFLVGFSCNVTIAATDYAAPYVMLKKNGTATQLIAGPVGWDTALDASHAYQYDLKGTFPIVLANGDTLTAEILDGGSQTYFTGGTGTGGANWFTLDPLYN